MQFIVPPDVQDMVTRRHATGSTATKTNSCDPRSWRFLLAELDANLLAIEQAVHEGQEGDDGVDVNQAIEQIRSRVKERSIVSFCSGWQLRIIKCNSATFLGSRHRRSNAATQSP